MTLLMGKHTLTPWRTTNDHANKICDQVGRKIAVCPTHSGGGQWRDREEADANAALIVRAVNAHEALVAFVQGMTSHGDDLTADAARKLLASLD
jgi:hypothetical protein